jgi:hypothetical protein
MENKPRLRAKNKLLQKRFSNWKKEMYKSGAKCKQEMAFPQDVLLRAGGQIFEEVEVEILKEKLKFL